MKNCEKGKNCVPLTITRYHLNDSIKMIFPTGGSQTTVYIFAYDSALKKWAKDGCNDFPTSKRQIIKYAFEGKPSIDLTGLPDGSYSGLMFGCNLGGGFGVSIVTKSKDLTDSTFASRVVFIL